MLLDPVWTCISLAFFIFSLEHIIKCISTKYVNFLISKRQIKVIYIIIKISEYLEKNHNCFMKGAISKSTKIFDIHKSCSPKCHSELLISPS